MIFMVKLLQFLSGILGFYMWIVIASVVISLVNPDTSSPIVRFLYSVTEPVFVRIRRFVPTNIGSIDLAPIILIFLIVFFQSVVFEGLIYLLVGTPVNIIR